MSAVLPFLKMDSTSFLARYFTPYQMAWIQGEDSFHASKQQVFALAEKSVRIGWTFCDAFKNVRKRLLFPKRDYLFATVNWESALEYIQHVREFAELLGYSKAILSYGDNIMKVSALDPEGRPTSLTEEVRIGCIKFDNGSRIMAFSSNPYAMAVHGGDVGLDEFAKHPNAPLLWQTAQGRVTWGYDLAVWSSHDGEDTLFNQFARQARLSCTVPPPGSDGPLSPPGIHNSDSAVAPPESPTPQIENQNSKIKNPTSLWNLYFRVTMPDAVEMGLLDVINRTQETTFTAEQFLTDCQVRAGNEEIYQQSYLCNPLGSTAAAIVDSAAIERCRYDYEIDRFHCEQADINQKFGEFSSPGATNREYAINNFLLHAFNKIVTTKSQYRLGFDVAASGQGDLAVIYIDEVKGSDLWLRALLTCRTEDWHFLKTMLFFFLKNLRSVQAAGDETGLGKQICWEAENQYGYRFKKVNFTSKKHDLGCTLMNQLQVAEKRFPRNQQDIASDYSALRKVHNGSRWVFTEGRNLLNPVSHCDIAWAGALATYAHTENRYSAGGCVVC